MNNEKPLVSVVICAFSLKRFDMTVDCIHSIFDNTYKNYEIILVIDGNEQLMQKMKDKYKYIDKVRVVGNQKDAGPSTSRNRGIEISNGDIIAFIDDDALAPINWLELIVKNFFDYPNIMVIGGKLLPIYNDYRNNNNGKGYRKLPEELLWIVGCTYKGHTESKRLVRNVISANMAARKDIFNEVSFESMRNSESGLLTPNKQLEDTLFCVNVNNKRVDTVLYDPDIVVRHNVSVDRLKLTYIINRSFSEGILKAQLKHVENKTINKSQVLSYEQNYLNMLLVSIIKGLCVLNIRKSMLLSIVVASVGIGYVSETMLRMIERR